jgi:hypothetical protein
MKYHKLDIIKQQEDFKLNVQLRNLGDVNYFAGESNSGKSLLLYSIFRDNPNVASIKDSPFMSEFWDENILSWEELINDRNVILDVIDYKQASKNKVYNDTISEVDIIIKEFGQYEISMLHKGKNTDPNGSTTSLKKIYNLIFWVVYLYLSNGTTEFIIDEPECHLHPHITKTIPLLLEYLVNRYELQFFVSTHSPFILSAVARITYEETSIKQTVYFLKNGHLIDKYNKESDNASMGYWGQKLIPVANAVLGSGLEDLYIEQEAAFTPDASILILCEGQSGDEDASVYNIIFNDLRPYCLFASCRGSSQLYRSFQLFNQVKPGISANLKLYMIRDRDGEFPNEEAIQKWETDNPGAKILSKRAIECYLFSVEVAKLFNEKYKQTSDNSKMSGLERLHNRITREVESGIKTSNYKEDLYIEFNKATNFGLESKIPENLHYETLATLITTNTKIYKELYHDIFK